ncbi:DUF3987 domain-containing protein [Coraliomargarita sp. SDUM461004]|uniref:DUF3987 domain-containing protein n=1 Tax=Thalassobacterium sedimentorum TaxID=3041258 RepID=A0ABU1AGU5_9BACT|nr:DUF3987 domain-containing protein [Coraliomargarita sp. SDUM461004]MDQ8194045.1 DUF3987 domain-containing protein [Coraliomargarita sp. SDUM461004]
MLKKTATGANRYYQGTTFAPDPMGKQRELSCDQPYLTYYGVTTPAQFFDSISHSSIEGGWLCRVLFFIELDQKRAKGPREMKYSGGAMMPKHVNEVLQFFRDADPDRSETLDFSKYEPTDESRREAVYTEPKPFPITIDADADEWLHDRCESLRMEAVAASNDDMASMVGRLREICTRLALIDAVSDTLGRRGDLRQARVTLDNAQRAFRMALHNVRRKYAILERNVGTSERVRIEAKIIDKVRSSPAGFITFDQLRNIVKRSSFSEAACRDQLIAELEQEGRIRVEGQGIRRTFYATQMVHSKSA